MTTTFLVVSSLVKVLVILLITVGGFAPVLIWHTIEPKEIHLCLPGQQFHEHDAWIMDIVICPIRSVKGNQGAALFNEISPAAII